MSFMNKNLTPLIIIIFMIGGTIGFKKVFPAIGDEIITHEKQEKEYKTSFALVTDHNQQTINTGKGVQSRNFLKLNMGNNQVTVAVNDQIYQQIKTNDLIEFEYTSPNPTMIEVKDSSIRLIDFSQ